jgi:DNA mismatch endonuclease (patch repair protein)
MDSISKEKRSEIMRRVKSINTTPEITVRRYLHNLGFRFSLHKKQLPGKPDIVLTKYKTVINVHGCFWHGHAKCNRSSIPKTNSDYWLEKIERNKLRDLQNEQTLIRLGWEVIVIFECELKLKSLNNTMSDVISRLQISKV